MEHQLLHAAIKSRQAFELFSRHLDPKAKSREYQLVFAAIAEYYQRDPNIPAADPAVLGELLLSKMANVKHRERFASMLSDVLSSEVSVANLAELVLVGKRNEIADKLAIALANRDDKAAALIEEYNALRTASSLDEALLADVTVLRHDTIEDVIRATLRHEGALRLFPGALDQRLDGRLSPGHHVTTFAVPEMGKTALNVTIASGFCHQGAKGIYFINEDREQDIYFRHVSCMSSMPYDAVAQDPATAIAKADARGIQNLTVMGLAPGSMAQIFDIVEKEEPKWIVIDQLINLNEKGDGLSQILGKAVRGARNLAKKAGIIVVSTCQAGDSAEGKAVLGRGDVYQSNTEVPAQCDVLLGIGATKEQENTGYRTFTLIKNKITGDHSSFTQRLVPQISRYQDP